MTFLLSPGYSNYVPVRQGSPGPDHSLHDGCAQLEPHVVIVWQVDDQFVSLNIQEKPIPSSALVMMLAALTALSLGRGQLVLQESIDW